MSEPKTLTRREFLHVSILAAAGGALAACATPAPLLIETEEEQAFRIGAVFQRPRQDSWAAVVHEACLQVQRDMGVEYEFSEKVAAADFEDTLRAYAQRGSNLIVGDAFLAGEEPSRKVAEDYPETTFCLGSAFGPANPNFSVFDNWIHEPAYLSGVMAGRLTETDILGAVAAIPLRQVNRLVNAFKQGALSVNPEVKVKIGYIGGWYDPTQAQAVAQVLIGTGADLLYGERLGVFEACQENGVLAFGNMTDQNHLAPEVVIAGPLWNMVPTIRYCIELTQRGAWVPEDLRRFSMMASGGASLAPFHGFEDQLPPELIEEVRALEQQILNGTFQVPVDEAPPISD
jgi:basic membrane lipoprotein Med (substrate-binding protein (PBP1-ABC) superfamily)